MIDKVKRVTSITLASTMLVSSLTGCSGKVEQLPLVSALTQQELMDYYTKSLNYKQEVEHSSGFKKVEYELNEVSTEVTKALTQATVKIEENLSTPVWQDSMYLTKDMHQHLKAMLDDKVLTRAGTPINVKESQGHYFVDVEYKVAPNTTGTFTNNIKYLGVHGAFKEDGYKNILLDTPFTQIIDNTILTYETGQDNISSLLGKQKANSILQERANTIERNVGGDREVKQSVLDIDKKLRIPQINITLVNKLLGSSTRQVAIMPTLTTVYRPTTTTGLTGYGIYPQGNYTLSKFGFNRGAMQGKLEMRYVFKKGLVDTSKLAFKNAYITEYSIDDQVDFKKNANATVIPEFVEQGLGVTLERSDRCISNNDLAGLMNGLIYADSGVATLTGFTKQHSNVKQQTTKLTRVLDRIDNNYLVEVSMTRKQGSKGKEDYGTYVYNGVMVISQVGNDFIITDYLLNNCEMTREPSINTDDTLLKRLASLSNRGLIADYDKEHIASLMAKLYNGGTERKATEISDCFNNDTQLLSSTRREYLISQLKNWLVASGMDVSATYKGFICEWVGGTEEQAEYITQELVDYAGKDKGKYIKAYYLVSRFGDSWLIDDIKVIETKEVTGKELGSIRKSIDGQKPFEVASVTYGTETKAIMDNTEAQ